MAKKSSKDDDKLFAFLGVFLTWVGFIIVYLTKKDSKYAMYYAKQGLVLGIASVVVWFAGWILWMVPMGSLISSAIWIIWLVLWFMGWLNALSDKMKPTPIIGQWADKFNL